MAGLQTAHASVIGDALTAGTQAFIDQSAQSLEKFQLSLKEKENG
jgi:hypothetical protein